METYLLTVDTYILAMNTYILTMDMSYMVCLQTCCSILVNVIRFSRFMKNDIVCLQTAKEKGDKVNRFL